LPLEIEQRVPNMCSSQKEEDDNDDNDIKGQISVHRLNSLSYLLKKIKKLISI